MGNRKSLPNNPPAMAFSFLVRVSLLYCNSPPRRARHPAWRVELLTQAVMARWLDIPELTAPTLTEHHPTDLPLGHYAAL